MSSEQDIIDEAELSSVSLAAYRGWLDRLEYMKLMYVDFREKDRGGRFPIQRAAAAGNLDVVKFLIAEGVSVMAKDSHDMTVLWYANYFFENWPVLVYLVKQIDEEMKGIYDDWKLLVKAANEDRENIVRYLLEKCLGDPVFFNKDQLLHIATQDGIVEVTEFLLENGADVFFTGRDNGTVLHEAAYSKNTSTVLCVLDYIKKAVNNDKEKIKKILNAEDIYGESAIKWDTSDEICQILINHGASL